MISDLQSGIKNLAKGPIKRFWHMQSSAGAAKLAAHENEKLVQLARAIDETLSGRLAIEEQEWIARIEERRSELLASTQQLTLVDFGAGSGKIKRTITESKDGVESVTTVARHARASKKAFYAKLLFKIIRHIEPDTIVELGSCVGISAAYQAAALQLNGKGRLTTLEGAREVADIARQTLDRFNFNNVEVVVGPFHQTLEAVLKEKAPIDYFFNDGHHDGDAVLKYFNMAAPHLADGAVVIFDDIRWSPSMTNAWQKLKLDSRISSTIDLRSMGIAIVESGYARKEHYNLFL